MRAETESPFLPGSGRVPSVWAGRDSELADGRAAGRRRLAGIYERGRAVLGEFGIGKSVLVNRIANELGDEGHWIAPPLRLPLGSDPLPLLGQTLRELSARHRLDERIGAVAAGLLERVAAVSLPVVGGGVSLHERGAEGYRDVLRLLVHVARLAREDRCLLVLRVDEVQNAETAALSRLLVVLGDALESTVEESDVAGLRQEALLPLLVYLSGLPDFRTRAADAGATFARRFRTFELEHLEEVELRDALIPFTTDGWPVLTVDGPSTVRMAMGAADLVVERCTGDPFLFQLAGEAAWNAGDSGVITQSDAERGWRQIRREVVRYVQGRLGDLSDLQLEYLEAAARLENEERSSAAVARAMGRDGSQEVASTAQSLDRTHRLIRRETGMIRFRSPVVRAYLSSGWP